MQCYTILYSKEGNFIIFEKREDSYFFHTNNGNGTIYNPPIIIPEKKGGGLYAFPGGKLDTREIPFQGCLREFIEECGANIIFGFQPVNQPQTLDILRTITIDGIEYTITGKTLDEVSNKYYALYVEFDLTDLKQIQNIITNTNFEQANDARSDIRHNEIRNYNEIFEGYPFCPLDDELGFSQLWQVQRDINQINLLQQNPATDWYYDMIMYLSNNILHLN